MDKDPTPFIEGNGFTAPFDRDRAVIREVDPSTAFDELDAMPSCLTPQVIGNAEEILLNQINNVEQFCPIWTALCPLVNH